MSVLIQGGYCLTQCETINVPGEYTIDSDITATPNCINIVANNVILMNPNGHKITSGDSSLSCLLISGSNVMIQGLILNNCGINVQASTNVELNHITIAHVNVSSSFVLSTNAENFSIVQSTFVGPSSGLQISLGSNFTFLHNSVTASSGLEITQTNGINIAHNFFEIQKYGIYMSTFGGLVTIDDNTIISRDPISETAGMYFNSKLSESALSITNNYYETKYTAHTETCPSYIYGMYFINCRNDIVLTNNTLNEVGPFIMSSAPCTNLTRYGGINIIGNSLGFVITHVNITVRKTVLPGGAFQDDASRYAFGIAAMQSQDIFCQHCNFVIHGGSRSMSQFATNMPGMHATGVYIGEDSSIDIDSCYIMARGGNGGIVYLPNEDSESYNTAGGDAHGAFIGGGAFSGSASVIELYGGDGFAVSDYSGTTYCTGGAVDHPDDPVVAIQGGNCVAPYSQEDYLSRCGSYSGFKHTTVRLYTDITFASSTCMSVMYAENVTFYGNGFSIRCFQEDPNAIGLSFNKIANSSITNFNVIASPIILNFLGGSWFQITESNFSESSYGLQYRGENNEPTITLIMDSVIMKNVSTPVSSTIQGNLPILQITNCSFSSYKSFSVRASNSFIDGNKFNDFENNGLTLTLDEGIISNNVFENGTKLYSVLQLHWDKDSITSTRSIANNQIRGVQGHSDASLDFNIIHNQCSSAQKPIMLYDNLIEDIRMGCLRSMSGILHSWCPSDIINNEVRNFRPVSLATPCINEPVVSVFKIENANTNLINSVASHFTNIPSGQSTSALASLTVVTVSSGYINIIDCHFDHFIAGNRAECQECENNSASRVAGFVYIAVGNTVTHTITNTTFSNFVAGNGGDISGAPINAVANGGEVVGIAVGGQDTKVIVSNSTFENFFAGQDGSYEKDTPITCPGGLAYFSMKLIDTAIISKVNVTIANFIGRNCFVIDACGKFSLNNLEVQIENDLLFSSDCIIIVDSANITINGMGSNMRTDLIREEDTLLLLALSIRASENVTVRNLAFHNDVSLGAEQSKNILIEYNVFNSSRIVSLAVDSTIIANNLFFGDRARILNRDTQAPSQFTHIIGNTFRNLFSAMDVIVDEAIVENNVFENIGSAAAFASVYRRAVIVNNTVLNGPTSYPFQISLMANAAGFVENNKATNIAPTEQIFSGFTFACLGENTIEFNNNLLENVTYSSAITYGINVRACKVLINNYTMNNIIASTYTPTVMLILINLDHVTGSMKNITISGVTMHDSPISDFMQSGLVVLGTTQISIQNISIEDFTVSDVPNCNDCDNTDGDPLAVFYLYASSATIDGVTIDRVHGGNAGNITANVSSASAVGGKVVLFYFLLAASDVNVSNVNYRNIQGGNGGFFDFADNATCLGGQVIDALGDYGLQCNYPSCDNFMRYIDSPNSFNVHDGKSCFTNPDVTSSTTGEETTGTSSGEATTTGTTESTTGEETTGTSGESTTASTTTSTTDPSTTSSTTDTTTGTTSTDSSTGTTSTDSSTGTSSTTSESTSTSTSSVGVSTTSTSSGSEIPKPTGVMVTPLRTVIRVQFPVNAKRMAYASAHTIHLLRNGNWTVEYEGGENQVLISNLQPNTDYQLRLAAVVGSDRSDFVYYNVTTLPLEAPKPPTNLTYSSYERDYIAVIWNPPTDNGGLSVTNYTLQQYNNDDWIVLVTENTTSYIRQGLTMNNQYYFRVFASNNKGASNFTFANLTTAPFLCGDGICDTTEGETCNSCYFDCPTLCAPKECTGGCNNRGECLNGICKCNTNWNGPTCNLNNKENPVTVVVNTTKPITEVSLDPTQNPSYPDVQFTIDFYDIQEVDDSGKTVSGYSFSEQEFDVTNGTTTNVMKERIYSTVLPNKAEVSVYISVFAEDSEVLFANQTIFVAANGVKYAMKISNWPFMSIKNKLLVRMISEGEIQGGENECIQVSAGEDTNSLHWLQISVNGVVLYGKFSELAIVDGKIKVAQYKYNRETNLVDIIVPHFWTAAEFDPDFQVLFNKEEADACGSKIQKDKFTSGAIAGIAVGVVVGIALIAGAFLFVTLRARRNKTKRRLRGQSNRMSSSVPMGKMESSDSFGSRV